MYLSGQEDTSRPVTFKTKFKISSSTQSSIRRSSTPSYLPQRSISESFFKILVINPLDKPSDEYTEFIDEFDLIIFTHLDRPGALEASNSFNFNQEKCFYLKSGPIGAEGTSSGPIGAVDSKGGPIGPILQNESALSTIILSKYKKLLENNPISLSRHRNEIGSIYERFQEFSMQYTQTNDVGIISSELNILGHHVEGLIGIVKPDDVLNHVFGNFCIGK